ncbi:MAG TPA: pyrimidine 5'-nucleotidase [Anaerolineaceae bacterium]|jgi:putative hydrolase of the HAD superfamily
MRLKTFFIDLDDTLYPPSAGIWERIRERMSLFMLERLHIPSDEIQPLRHCLYETYGTTLRGLELVYHIDTDEFLRFVHDVPIEDCISPDPLLRQVLHAYPQRKIIFTNADCLHAERVLAALNLADCFESIIDIRQIHPNCKPQPEAFSAALAIAGETDPSECLMADDSDRNIEAARAAGLFTIHVTTQDPHPSAHHHLAHLRDLPTVLPVGE